MKDKFNMIINIGRQVGSGGGIIAQMLAKEFDCKCYDKEILNLAAKESGFSKEFFEKNDEHRGFFQSLFHMHTPLISDDNFYNNKFSQESLFQIQSDAILKAARQGNCIFVGRAADYVLRDFDNTVNVFISADMEERIKTVRERQNIDSEAAQKFINEKENERAAYYNYYTGKKWGNCCSYDLCINTSVLGLEKSKQFIASFILERFNQ
ncbi:MAG: cytidylate kinase-like family protein [Prevotella sp.]